MFEVFIEFYTRAFAVILPALVVAIFAINAKKAGLDMTQTRRLLIPLTLLLGLLFAFAFVMAQAGLLLPPPTIAIRHMS